MYCIFMIKVQVKKKYITRDCVWNVLDDCLRDDRAQDRHRPHRVHKDQPPAPARHVAKPSVPAADRLIDRYIIKIDKVE